MKNTQIYPVIKIGDDYFSTNNTTFEGNYCKPILLNIPSIKQSVDIESRKFKISNVSLDLSNFPVSGDRFSDRLSTSSLINTEVVVYFVHHNTSQEVYRGQVRRISHDDEKVKIELEDLTEQKAHKPLPKQSLGDGINVPDRYKNKPIPMVYGHVDRSPCVVDLSLGNHIIPDTNIIKGYVASENSLIGNWIYPLYISNGSSYVNVPRYMLSNSNNLNNNFGWDLDQYIVANNTTEISFTTSTKQYSYNSSPFNNIDCNIIELENTDLFTNNLLFVANLSRSKTFDVLLPPSNWVGSQVNSSVEATSIIDLSPDDFSNLSKNNEEFVLFDNFRTYNSGSDSSPDDSAYPFLFFKYFIDRSYAFEQEKVYFYFNGVDMERDDSFRLDGYHENYEYTDITGTFTHDNTFFQGSPLVDTGYQMEYIDIQSDFLIQYKVHQESEGLVEDFNLWNISHLAGTQGTGFQIKTGTNTDEDLNNLTPTSFDGFKLGFAFVPFGDSRSPEKITIKVRAKNLDYWRWGISKDVMSRDFYVNVEGRKNTLTNTPLSSEQYLIQNPIDIIYDILRNELGLERNQINEVDFLNARNQHNDWKFGFTVNKKINSKKLIEEIAKSTKCFPNFRNDGTFSFNAIKDEYSQQDIDNATLIKESELINYSFKKTKPEDIVSEVGVKYKKDYAQDSYTKDVFSYIEEEYYYSKFSLYNNNPDRWAYYGIENPEDALLEIESDYIRDDETAANLRQFLFEHHKNDHLIFNVKLPISYNQLQVGDLVKFDKLFNGITAYGIDYTQEEIVNGQTRYPLFMITSIAKNLDSISIECMQLHELKPAEQPFYMTYTNNQLRIKGNMIKIHDELYEIQVRNGIDYRNMIENFIGASTSTVQDVSYLTEPEAYVVEIDNAPEGEKRIFEITNFGYLEGEYTALSLVPKKEHDINDDGVYDVLIRDSDVHYFADTSISEPTDTFIFMFQPFNPDYLTDPDTSVVPTGDVNYDGELNLLDIVQTSNYIMGNIEFNDDQRFQANLNFDAGVGVLDIVLMVIAILGE